MNRFASVLAGGLTAAVSGAVIAAAAVGQGVFDSPSKPSPKQDQVASASTWTSDPTVVATAEQEAAVVQPRIVYVDKDPVVVVQTYQQPVAGSSALNTATASPTQPPTKTPTAPTVAAAPASGEPSGPERTVPEPRVQQLPPVVETKPVEKPDTSVPKNTAPTNAAPTNAAPTNTLPANTQPPTRPHHDDGPVAQPTGTGTAPRPTSGGEHERD